MVKAQVKLIMLRFGVLSLETQRKETEIFQQTTQQTTEQKTDAEIGQFKNETHSCPEDN
ncbi:hypothetical protein [Microcoleus asticus]|uniref:Uncharacterized protein n=1 Tax=Microcoleus asticus IPMA8 TaxID=2563858 RepID=A0ABX2D266_9CYAN|nr:hypothetical protein [Microcoleus asticus IPMA8]